MRKLKLDELNRLSTDEFKNATKNPVIIVLDNIRSAMNVGSVFRTSDAFLIEEIILVGITAQPPNREIQKTALGATETVTWKYFSTATECIQYLREKNYTILSVEQSDNSVMLPDFKIDINGKYALVLGNEVDGVSYDFIHNSQSCIEVPQFGTKHSLNVSVCAGIVTWYFITRFLN